ncbi:hypothetical protein RHS02_00523, partial [Rhizoctonia solani]
MNVPAGRIKVVTNIPNTTLTTWDKDAHRFISKDLWSFNFVTFCALDYRKSPPRDWNHRNFNEWFMLIHESNKTTRETRAIYCGPEYTTDGRVKGVHILLHPTPDPEGDQWTVKQYKVEEWPIKPNKAKPYEHFFHSELLKIIKSIEWKETYLYTIPPFDSNRFCINFAGFLCNMGLIDYSDAKYLLNLTRTPWPRPDGSTLPYRI